VRPHGALRRGARTESASPSSTSGGHSPHASTNSKAQRRSGGYGSGARSSSERTRYSVGISLSFVRPEASFIAIRWSSEAKRTGLPRTSPLVAAALVRRSEERPRDRRVGRNSHNRLRVGSASSSRSSSRQAETAVPGGAPRRVAPRSRSRAASFSTFGRSRAQATSRSDVGYDDP
jgi:hypothetical protein